MPVRLFFYCWRFFRGGLTVGKYIAAINAIVNLDGIWDSVAGYLPINRGRYAPFVRGFVCVFGS